MIVVITLVRFLVVKTYACRRHTCYAWGYFTLPLAELRCLRTPNSPPILARVNRSIPPSRCARPLSAPTPGPN